MAGYQAPSLGFRICSSDRPNGYTQLARQISVCWHAIARREASRMNVISNLVRNNTVSRASPFGNIWLPVHAWYWSASGSWVLRIQATQNARLPGQYRLGLTRHQTLIVFSLRFSVHHCSHNKETFANIIGKVL